MKNKKIYFLVLFTIFSLLINSKKIYTYDNIKFDALSNKDGLNNSPINYIYQDSIGYLWFATKTNLLRYDGESIIDYSKKLNCFSNFSTKNITFISSKNSKLYFVTKYEITILDVIKKKLKTYYNRDFKNKGKYSLIERCLVDKKGNLWVATQNGLFKSVEKDGEILEFKLIKLDKKRPFLPINRLYQDKYENIWVGTKKGVYIYNEKANRTINIEDYYWQIQPYIITKIEEDKKGNIWIGQTKRVIKFESGHNYFLEKKIEPNVYFLPDNYQESYVRDFSFDKDSNLWILKPNMINIIEFKNKSYKIHNILGSKNIFPFHDLTTLRIDKHGLVFIGSSEGNIIFHNPYSGKIQTKYPKDYNGTFNLNCACKDYKGNIWLGVDDNELFYYITKEDRFIRLHFNNDFIIRNIFETKSHEIFFTSMSNNIENGGLFKVENTETFYKDYNKDALRLKLYNTSNIKGVDKKFCIAYFATQDYDGSLWYISIHGGTYHLKYENKKITLIDNFSPENYKKYNLSSTVGENINILSDSSLFISSSAYNMIKYNRKDNKFEDLYFLNEYMLFNNVNGFNFSYLDEKGRHWLGTEGGGLIRYPKEDSIHYKIFDKNNGFISNNIHSKLIDNKKRLWIGTSQGIAIIDTKGNIFRINKKDGLRNQFINKFSTFKLNDSILCFGGRGGINLINSNTILNKLNYTNAHIGISNIKIEGVEYMNYCQEKTKTNYNTINHISLKTNNTLVITISTLSFASPKENSITYRLLPINKEWTTNPIGNKKIKFNNLKKGKYTLQCKVINSNGKISNIQKDIEIIVSNSIYKRWWFYLIIILIVFILSYISQFLLRLNIVKKNNKLKDLVNKQTEILLQNNKKLQQKTEELSNLNKTRNKLFSVISQNLIKPLGKISKANHRINENYENLLKSEQLKEIIDENNEPLSNLYELLQNLLFWSRQQDTNVKIKLTKFKLKDVFLETNSYLEFQLNSRGNVLIDKIPDDIELYADRQMIHIIFRNILSLYNLLTKNSSTLIKATQNNKDIRISISNKKLIKIEHNILKTINSKNINSLKNIEEVSDTNLKITVTKKFIYNHNGTIHAEYSKTNGLIINFTIEKNIHS